MDAADKRQLDLYLDPDQHDDLLGHRFSAFLRQNPRALAALDPDVLNAILGELGELPTVEHPKRRLPARSVGLVALALAVAVLPLAAQYLHQRGLLQGLNTPAVPPPITPFAQQVAARSAAPVRHVRRVHHAYRPHRARAVPRVAVHHAPRVIVHHDPHRIAVHHAHKHVRAIAHHRRALPKRVIAYAPRPHQRRAQPAHPAHREWKHPYEADTSVLGARARLHVSGYLRAIVDGNLTAAFAHLGMPATADRSALAELAIISPRTRVAILGSKPEARDTEQVQADIVTEGREYYEVFYVVRDGAAVRITERFYIPVNHRAQVAVRSLEQRTH
jgi:hypothetical protein